MSSRDSRNQEAHFSIVPGEDELLSRPRPGQRPVKTVHWPSILLSLLAVAGVAALAFVYWQDRQSMLSANQQVNTQRQQNEQELASVKANIDKLQQQLSGLNKQVIAIPEVNPQQIQALEVQVSALTLATQQLDKASDTGANDSDHEQPVDTQALSRRVDALEKGSSGLDRQLKTLNYRTGSLEQRVDGMSTQLSTANGSN